MGKTIKRWPLYDEYGHNDTKKPKQEKKFEGNELEWITIPSKLNHRFIHHQIYCGKTTGNPVKWVICFSSMLLHRLLAKF